MRFAILVVLAFAPGLHPATAGAAPRADKVQTVLTRKTQGYIHDGVFVGGDQAIDGVVVRDVRRAANAGYERLVIDLEGTNAGEAPAIGRPPYFQVAVSPEENRLVVTLWGSPKLRFDAPKVLAAFRKSPIFGTPELLPRLEERSWTFSVPLKSFKPVEVFELTNPVRIIIDLKTAAKSNNSKNN